VVLRPNPGEPATGSGWARAGDGLRVSGARFEGSVRAEVLPVSLLSGATVQPPGAWFRRSYGEAGSRCSAGGSGGL
jgi:hypothetical protein